MHDHDYQPDAHLDALLDEALSPDCVDQPMSPDLNARILAALPLHTIEAQGDLASVASPSPVIARVGFFASMPARRLAAAVLVVMGIGAAIIGAGLVRNAQYDAQKAQEALAVKEAAQQLVIAKLTSDIESAPLTPAAARDLHHLTFATNTMADSSLDHSIDTLKSRTDHAALMAGVESWSSVAQSLEAELDALEADGNKG